MTKQSAIATAGALVLGLMAGVAGHDLSKQAPSRPTQIIVQIGPGGSTTSTTTVPTVAPPRTNEGG